MTRYLVAIHHPYDCDPSAEDEAMDRDIDALNDEMVAAGVRIFVGGLQAARNRCGRRQMARCSSPPGRISRPRSTSAVFRCL